MVVIANDLVLVDGIVVGTVKECEDAPRRYVLG